MASSRATPRPLAYIHPRLNCDSASPARAAVQYNCAARAGSLATPSPCSCARASMRKELASTMGVGETWAIVTKGHARSKIGSRSKQWQASLGIVGNFAELHVKENAKRRRLKSKVSRLRLAEGVVWAGKNAFSDDVRSTKHTIVNNHRGRQCEIMSFLRNIGHARHGFGLLLFCFGDKLPF